MSFRVDFAKANDFTAAQLFYDGQGYRGDPINDSDKVLLAWHGNSIVGIVRVCQEDGFLCLRGMRIHQDFRRIGLGSDMLQRLESELCTQPSYCLPYPHLANFYNQIGFVIIPSTQLPNLLEKRMSAYLVRGIEVIAMYRSVGEHALH